jgi:protein-L-isoaspartate(D-aspartate) O-methyltransferase
MEDNYRHKGMRRNLVEVLKGKGITDAKVLDVINKVPRHFFLDLAFVNQAYSDVAFQIGAGQTISQPYTVAFQTQLLNIEKRSKVLEIGTGSGYQTAVLCEMGAKVYSIERQRELYLKTRPLLDQLGYPVKLFFGDGYKGQSTYAPYDRILITCGAPFVPDALVEQLKPGGMMVIPLGEGDTQIMTRVTKKIDGELEIEKFGRFSFVPMLEKTAK